MKVFLTSISRPQNLASPSAPLNAGSGAVIDTAGSMGVAGAVLRASGEAPKRSGTVGDISWASVANNVLVDATASRGVVGAVLSTGPKGAGDSSAGDNTSLARRADCDGFLAGVAASMSAAAGGVRSGPGHAPKGPGNSRVLVAADMHCTCAPFDGCWMLTDSGEIS